MSRRALVAVFEREEDLLSAVRAARATGQELGDVHTPYPVHGLEDAMGLSPSRLPWVCLVFGLAGLVGGIALQVWTSAVDWPVNIGGKPANSMPAFIPVAFELTILCAGLATFVAFLVAGRLAPGRRARAPAERLMDDRFALVLLERDSAFDPSALADLFREQHGAVRVEERLEGRP